MAIAFVGGVCNLVAKLLAHTLILGDHFASAGAVAVPSFQRLLQALHQFLVFVQADLHTRLLAFIIHAHGGELKLTDNVPHGCVFTFTLLPGEVKLDE